MKKTHAMVCGVKRRWTRIVALMSLLSALGAMAAQTSFGAASWPMRGVGSDEYGWVLMSVNVAAAGPNGETIQRGQIYQIPASAPLGTVLPMRAHALNEPPMFLSAFGDRLALVYPSTAENQAKTEAKTEAKAGAKAGAKAETSASMGKHTNVELLYPVRSVRVALVNEYAVFYDPPDRYVIEDSLSTPGHIVSVADTALGFAALMRVDKGVSVQLLDRNGWRELATPAEMDAGAPIALFADGDKLAAVTRSPAGSAELWRLDQPGGVWERSTVDAEALKGDLVETKAGLVSSRYDALRKTLSFRLVTTDRAVELATIKNIPASHALTRVGENLTAVWMDEGASTRMRVVVVSSVTGRTLYDDFAILAPALSPADLRMVALLLSTVTLGVLLFLLKPEDAAQVDPPKGWMYASPGRRFAAGALDLLLAGLIAAAIWDESVVDVIDPSYLLLMNGGDSWPVLTVMGVYFLHGVIGEGFTGRTIGKVVLRIRAHSTRGPKVRLWQSAVRNLVKVIAPPLVGLVLIDPNRRHPGDLLAGTIVIAANDADADADDEDSGSSQDSAGDEPKSSDNATKDLKGELELIWVDAD